MLVSFLCWQIRLTSNNAVFIFIHVPIYFFIQFSNQLFIFILCQRTACKTKQILAHLNLAKTYIKPFFIFRKAIINYNFLYIFFYILPNTNRSIKIKETISTYLHFKRFFLYTYR